MQQLAEGLDLPTSRYEAADRSYRSVSAWLERDASEFAECHVQVYTQGSFRLGTAIAPIQVDADYDLDIVCEFDWSKHQRTQAELHASLGRELIAYARRHNMQAPSPWNRCWTINYADGARFHMDVLPCVPDGQRQRYLREVASVTLDYVDKSVSITDKEHPHFQTISPDWPVSNPNGYADWFHDQMRPVFDARRLQMMLVEAKADVADIPAFRVRTPLQLAIQILKRHRDLRFLDQDTSFRPTSVVLTTLAALAYRQEATVLEAVAGIIQRMDAFIESRGDISWIPNPADPRENLAEAWSADVRYREAFQQWLEDVRSDVRLALESGSQEEFIDAWSPRLGRDLVEAAVGQSQAGSLITRAFSNTIRKLRDAPHRAPVSWPLAQSGSVAIERAQFIRNGFRPQQLNNEGHVPAGSQLVFTAGTNVPPPYEVYWQIINTGVEAIRARDLRGRFENAKASHGHLVRRETAVYRGIHSVECFIVKQGYCVARSGLFVVNID
ncbi:hypothetical protein CH75_09225 [Dyella jiangningensis]|nr:hypothetical protein CH75_09225 [Dyella jiangningensis]